MEKERAVSLIEQKFQQAYAPYVTRVVYKNGTSFTGFFFRFDDYTGLRNDNKFRFVPVSNARIFQEHFQKHNTRRTDLSIIIEVEQIDRIEEIDIRTIKD